MSQPLSVVESTISFYTLFYRKPVGKYMLQVCRNLSCIINGAEEIMAYFREQLGIDHLETTADGLFSYEEVECLAACDRAPCMQINLRFKYDLTPQMIDTMLVAMRAGSYDVKPNPQTKQPGRTWKVEQDTGRKSAGGVGVSNPNNAGGVGDRSGVIMLDRIVSDKQFAQRSHERLAQRTAIASLNRRRRTPLVASPIVEVLTRGIGELNLRDIDVYRSTGGYVQLARAVNELGQKAVMGSGDGIESARPRRRRFSDRPQVVVLAR